MRKLSAIILLFAGIQALAQDSMSKKPIKIFDSEKAINANTPETVGAGKMAFKVTHNFGDIGGKFGGLKNFFGLDNAVDVKIGFEIGLCKNLDLIAARCKGASLRQQQWELGVKWKLLQQEKNGTPVSLALFANAVVATNTASSFPNRENSYHGFTERMSNVFQLILAKKMGKVSAEILPMVVTRGYTISYDQGSMFALGGALRIPLVENRLNLLIDYFHPFRKEAVEDSFKIKDNIEFHDPLGIGFEILTSGHAFRLNFTNASEILENRFIPRTITSWGDGQFRWCFTISRMFRLWKPKKM